MIKDPQTRLEIERAFFGGALVPVHLEPLVAFAYARGYAAGRDAEIEVGNAPFDIDVTCPDCGYTFTEEVCQ